jgi:hypothetical protein
LIWPHQVSIKFNMIWPQLMRQSVVDAFTRETS